MMGDYNGYPRKRRLLEVVKQHIKEEFETYCEQTQIHGPGRMVGSKHCTARYRLWVVITICAICLGIYFSYSVYEQFAASTVTTSIVSNTEGLASIQFPQLVICNNFKIRQSFLEHIITNKTPEEANDLHEAVYRNYISGYTPENEERESQDKYLLAKENLAGKLQMTEQELILYIQDNALQQDPVIEPVTRGAVERDVLTKCPVVYLTEPMRSGLTQGLEILLDTETYENADPSAESDGFTILVKNSYEASLVELNGVSVTPGSDVLLKLMPTLYTITDTAKSRFNHVDRKCIFDGEFTLPPNLKELSNSSEYSHATCLLAAAVEEMKRECAGLDTQTWINNGSSLGCMNTLLSNLGQFEIFSPVEVNRPVTCLVKCQRQVNTFLRVDYPFPNRMFARQRGFWWIISRLFHSCNPEQELGRPRGMKREVLLRAYPKVCSFFDKYVYENASLYGFFVLAPDVMANRVKRSFAEFVEETLNIPAPEFSQILSDTIQYSRENIIRVKIYLDRPYVTKYETDQVMSVPTFIANMGGMLGFAMGFSVVCAVEIVYCLFISPLIRIGQWLWHKESALGHVEITKLPK